MLKAIETEYRGYRFRSRLEARWAVFFDEAGIEWVYEPQGFDVNGRYYLPDFYLPQFGYFEVKGVKDYDPSLYAEFAVGLGTPIFVVCSEIPDPESESGYITSFGLGEDEMAWGWDDMFLQCSGCGKIVIQNEVYSGIKGNCGDGKGNFCEGHRHLPLYKALKAARGARWEHGDRPKNG